MSGIVELEVLKGFGGEGDEMEGKGGKRYTNMNGIGKGRERYRR